MTARGISSDQLAWTFRENPAGSDFLISCFAAAAQHYRCATVCTPFPQEIFRTASRDKNFAAARMTLDHLPPVSHLKQHPHLLNTLPSDCRALLTWLLLHESHQRRLASRTLQQLQQRLANSKVTLPPFHSTLPNTVSAGATLAQAIASNPSVHPQYIFENVPVSDPSSNSPPPPASNSTLTPSPSPPSNPSSTSAPDVPPASSTDYPPPSGVPSAISPAHLGRMSRLPSGGGFRPRFSRSMYAFHGTSMENVHSILRSGLLNLTGTQLQRSGALFGDGIYFSTDMSVAFSFCKPTSGWRSSGLGRRLRCLLLCELDVSEASLGTKVVMEDAHTGRPLPPTYILVKSADAVRISHLLVYRDVEPTKLLGHSRLNLCSLIILVYVLAMLYAGFADKALGFYQGMRHGLLWQRSYVG